MRWVPVVALITACSTSTHVASEKPVPEMLLTQDAELRPLIDTYLTAIGQRDLRSSRSLFDSESPHRQLAGSALLEKPFITATFAPIQVDRIATVDAFIVCAVAYTETLDYGSSTEEQRGWLLAILRRGVRATSIWNVSPIRDWDGPSLSSLAALGDSVRPMSMATDGGNLRKALDVRLSAAQVGDVDAFKSASCSDAARTPFMCAMGSEGQLAAGRLMGSGGLLSSCEVVGTWGDVSLCRARYVYRISKERNLTEVDALELFHRHDRTWKVAKEVVLSRRDV